MDEAFRRLQRNFRLNPDDMTKDRLDNEAKRIGRYRQMELKFRNDVIYQSTFYTDTGTLIRISEEEVFHDWWSDSKRERWPRLENEARREEWRKLYGHRKGKGFSPVPETIDIAINSWCNFGCTYCYTDATTRGSHAPIALIEKSIGTLMMPPYQIAYGGGSPTQHPDFIKILEKTRELGSIPNYTTEGQNLTDEILSATNQTCGGVALTYHAARGLDYFKDCYLKLRNRLNLQLNVHVIADRNVIDCLNQLRSISAETGKFNIVLLAFYPGVGRSDETGLMRKNTYMVELPDLLKKMIEEGHRIAFSEGLIPYFLSRPEIGISTEMMIPMEARFSCFIDQNGRMSHSSFNPPWTPNADTEADVVARLNQETVYAMGAQELWNKMDHWSNEGEHCDRCKKKDKCTVPDDHHYLICNYASHNNPKSQPRGKGKYGW